MELLRANSVQRFSMSPMTREQTIAAHQWDVAMLFIHLSQYIANNHIIMAADKDWLLTGTLLSMGHDMGEIFTGDAPAPFKRAFNITVSDKLPDWVGRLLTAWSQEVVNIKDVVIRSVVKSADLLSTWRWAKQFGNPGDRYTYTMTSHLYEELNVQLQLTAAIGIKHGYYFLGTWRSIPDTFREVSNVARNIWDLEEEEYDEE